MFVFPVPYVTAAAGLTTLSFITATTSVDSDTITAPATINAGDLLVMFDYGVKPSGGGVPSGWSEVADVTSAYVDVVISYKIAVGSEDGATITGLTGITGAAKIIQQFRGNIALSSITVQDLGSQITDGNPTSQTVTASGGAVPLIVFGMYGVFGTISPRTFTPTEDGETDNTAGANDLHAKFKIYNSGDTPVNHSIDMDDEGIDNALFSFYLEAA